MERNPNQPLLAIVLPPPQALWSPFYLSKSLFYFIFRFTTVYIIITKTVIGKNQNIHLIKNEFLMEDLTPTQN